MQEFSRIVNHTDPVGIPIRSHTDIAAPVQHIILQGAQGLGVWCRQLTAKQRVMTLVYDLQLTAGDGKQRLQGCLAHTVHGVKSHTKPFVLNGLHIHCRNNIVQIFIERIKFHNLSLSNCLLVRDRADGIAGSDLLLHLCYIRFNLRSLHLIGISSASGENLDPIVNGRIMAGCHHHAVGQIVGHHIIHDQRRGGRPVDKPGTDPLRCQYLT